MYRSKKSRMKNLWRSIVGTQNSVYFLGEIAVSEEIHIIDRDNVQDCLIKESPS